jgi:hypothetical protein
MKVGTSAQLSSAQSILKFNQQIYLHQSVYIL